ncbi:Rho guanine nucleotide exchange factor 12, partial [Ophiophagus hannah]
SSSRKTKYSSEESRSETYGLVQRCVIIQRDENGFGLTVSGDNPVFVQSVKEDGAAMRAGVQTGDRIIKVNGTLVTHSNHLEVVKLIK